MKNITKIIFAIFAVFILVGGIFVYSDHGNYSSDANMNADGKIQYSLSGPNAEYRYSVYTETRLPDRVYMFLDSEYKSSFNDYYQQSEFFSVMKQMLERRGYSAVYYANAEELKTVMTHPNYAVFFVSGALPDTVYDGTSGSSFLSWMNNGGTVYWSGPELGRYISSKTEIRDLNVGLFGGQVNDKFDETKAFGYDVTGMFKYTQMRRDETGYALIKDYADSLPLAYTDDKYSTTSVVKLRNGNAFIFGGNIAVTENVSQDMTDRTCCADLIIMGLTYHSHAVDCGSGSLRGSVNSTTAFIVSGLSDVRFCIYVGTPATHWGKSISII